MPVSRNSRLTLSFILITILLDMVGLGIILPVLPSLILELTHDTVARSAVIGGYLVFVYALLQFIFSPILGNLSDRFGRRPILLFSLLGLTADYLIMGFAPTIGWLFVGRILAGAAGAAGRPGRLWIVIAVIAALLGIALGIIVSLMSGA